MSRVIVLPPSTVLVEEVLRHLTHHGSNYSRNLVVFPGKRPAHFLRRAIGQLTQGSFVPPRIHSFDTFIAETFARSHDDSIRQLEPVDAAVLLHGIHLGSDDRIGGTRFDELEDFLPLGIRLFHELEELRLSARSLEEIERELSGATMRKAHLMASLYQQFYSTVANLGYSTRATRYETVASELRKNPIPDCERVVLGGLFALSGVERGIVSTLLDDGRTVLLLQDGPGIAELITDLGLPVESSVAQTPSPSVFFSSAPDNHGEIFGLATTLQGIIDRGGVLDERAVIVVPDPAVIPALVHHALSLIGDGYNISIGYPLRRTPVLGFLSSLMDLVATEKDGKVETSEYFRFIQHPYVRNILLKGRPHVSRILFQRIEESIRSGEAGSFVALEEIEKRDAHFLEAVRIIAKTDITPEVLRAHLRTVHRELIHPLLGVTSVGDCVHGCVRILTFVANQTTSRQHLFFRPYAEALIEALVRLAQCLISKQHLRTPESVFRILRAYLSEEKVALPGTPLRGVQVLGLLETRNLKFEYVFVLGAVDDLIPGQAGRYTILPDFARKRLGIPTLREHDRTSAYHFQLLVSAAREVHFFFSENNGSGASRFVEALLWNQEQALGFARNRSLVSRISYKIDLPHSNPEPIQKAPGLGALLRSLRMSATALDTYLKCGIKFYYRYVLRLEERDEPVGDIDRAGVGRFVHAVLAQYYKPFVGKTINGSELDRNRLMKTIDTLFLESFGKEEPGNQLLLKAQVRHQLEKFLEDFEIPRLSRAPAKIVDVEKDISVNRGGVDFWGRVDRIEKRGEEVHIIDFKTGGDRNKLKIRFGKLDQGDSSTWSEAIGSLQLPLYSMLYRGLPGSETTVIKPSYILLGRNKLDSEAELPLFEDGTDATMLEGVLDSVVMALVAEITDESKGFMPPERLDEQCPSCPFVRICGTEWVKEKRW